MIRRLVSRTAFLWLLLLTACATTPPTGDPHVVTRVIDGDTFVLDNGDRVRLIGVDTPETVHPTKPVEPFGPEASAFTRDLVEGKIVHLQYDTRRTGRYNRILAYVFVDDIFVNAELIRQGYARAYTEYPFRQDYVDLFTKLEQEARDSGRGMWKTPHPEPPAHKEPQ